MWLTCWKGLLNPGQCLPTGQVCQLGLALRLGLGHMLDQAGSLREGLATPGTSEACHGCLAAVKVHKLHAGPAKSHLWALTTATD